MDKIFFMYSEMDTPAQISLFGTNVQYIIRSTVKRYNLYEI